MKREPLIQLGVDQFQRALSLVLVGSSHNVKVRMFRPTAPANQSRAKNLSVMRNAPTPRGSLAQTVAETPRRWTAELAAITQPAPDFANGAIHHLDVNTDAAAERRYDEISREVMAEQAVDHTPAVGDRGRR
jgi:hypothetical protein